MQISLRRISSFRGILVYIKVIIIKNTDSKSKIQVLSIYCNSYTVFIHYAYTWFIKLPGAI